MRCVKIEQVEGQEGGTIRLVPVTGYGGEENKTFWKYTPSGTFEFNSINPAAFDAFRLGQEYYVDIIAVPEVVTKSARLAEVEKQLPDLREKARLNPTTDYIVKPLAEMELEAAGLRQRIHELEAEV